MSGGAKAAVSEYTMDRGTWPTDNATAGLAEAQFINGKYVTSVTVGPLGVLSVLYGGTDAHASLAGARLLMTPTTSAGSVEWDCASGTPVIAPRHLPAACR